MTAEIKRVGKHGLIYGLGIAASRAASVIMLPVYTRYLTPADYGAVELLTMTVDVLGMIVGLGITGAIFKCYSDADSSDAKRRVISTALLLLMGTMSILMLAGIAYSDSIARLVFGDNEFSKYFRIVFVTYFIQQGIISVPLMYIRAIDQPGLFVSLGLLKLALQISLNVLLLVHFHLGLMAVVLSACIAESVLGAYLLTYAWRRVGFHFSRAPARELIALGHPFILTSLSSFVLLFSDRFFLKAYGTLEAVGIYALAYKFAFALGALAVAPMQSAWDPQRYRIAKQDQGKQVFKQVFLYFNLVIVSISALIVLFVGDGLRIMAHSAYWPAANLVPLVIASYIVQTWTFFCDFGLYHARKTSRIATSSAIAAACVLALNFLLIPRYGAYGAAIATFGAFMVRFGLMFNAAQSYFPIDYGWQRIVRLLLIATLAYSVRRTVSVSDIGLSIFLDGALLLGFMLAVYFMILARSDREAIRTYFGAKLALLRTT